MSVQAVQEAVLFVYTPCPVPACDDDGDVVLALAHPGQPAQVVLPEMTQVVKILKACMTLKALVALTTRLFDFISGMSVQSLVTVLKSLDSFLIGKKR